MRASLYTCTSLAPPETYSTQPVTRLPIELILHTVRTIAVQVQAANSGEPLVGVKVRAGETSDTGHSSFGISDKDGKVALKLPPGTYKLQGDPPTKSDFARTSQELVVNDLPSEQPVTLRIQPGCVLVLKAIDSDTGLGIPDVTFWYEMTELPGGRKGRGMTSVQSHSTTVDNPKSNADGELRAVVTPGVRRYGIGLNPLPTDYEAVSREDVRPGRLLNLPAGETIKADFLLRKLAK
jgi:hypothetical protein